MKNTSIKQLNVEVETARKQALREPHRFERPDEGLSDFLTTVRPMQSGKQQIPGILKDKIEAMFANYPQQYKFLGLFYAAGFTRVEIAEREGVTQPSVTQTLNSAVKRLKKYLTLDEFESIRWTLGVVNIIEATPTRPETLERIARHKAFVADQPCYTVGDRDPSLDPIWRPLNQHPPEKFLPVPRGVLLDEAAAQ